jgi:hypothetical protein
MEHLFFGVQACFNRSIALSTMEAELMTASEAAKAAVHVIRAIQEFGAPLQFPITLWCDNEATVQAIHRPTSTSRSRHIEVRHFWLGQQETKKIFKVRHVRTAKNLADIGTKPLGDDTFL